MVLSVADSVMHDSDAQDTRPLKRSRKSGITSKPRDSDDNKYAHNVPVDHIFIAEGNVTKKPGGKKASWSVVYTIPNS